MDVWVSQEMDEGVSEQMDTWTSAQRVIRKAPVLSSPESEEITLQPFRVEAFRNSKGNLLCTNLGKPLEEETASLQP